MTVKGLSGNALKVIAIVAMTIEHLAWVGIETCEQADAVDDGRSKANALMMLSMSCNAAIN